MAATFKPLHLKEPESPKAAKDRAGKSDAHSKAHLFPWRMPQPYCSTLETLNRIHPLVVFNSLTRSKVRFIPRSSVNNIFDKTVTWYQCGPTVYAESHIGHARTYVSLDILRRIMQDVAGYNLVVCQNVTDIDDKIIIRSSEVKTPFAEFAKKYELEFNQDIYSSLEIIFFIEKLILNGVAYEANGSVYFSVSSFESQGHKYGKLMPEQIGNSALLAEGEGLLAACEGEKRHAADFALWKKKKNACEINETNIVEPFWESPWGHGRPGWHIECSAMAYSALSYPDGDQGGKTKQKPVGQVDVHAGGVDLKFPHHENEIAQSEGFLGPPAGGGPAAPQQWVNYWLHTGHLNILGLKMSKSLKNFISIRTALSTHTSRQLRFLFLLHKYNSTMDYGDGSMTQAVNIERVFAEYFHNIKATLRRLQGAGLGQAAGQDLPMKGEEANIRRKLQSITAQVRAALLDDFDTPVALGLLAELVRDCNKYIETEKTGRDRPLCASSLLAVAKYVTSILRVFGLVNENTDIGFGDSAAIGDDSGSSGISREQTLAPLLDLLAGFREAVRKAAICGDHAAVLRLADVLRDDQLPELGVRMEDRGCGDGNTLTVWKLEDPQVLRKERLQKEAMKEAKEQQRLLALKKQQEKDEKARQHPRDMFRNQTELYSAFDSDGLPTHDSKGEPLAKAAVKRLQKEWAKQKEAHEKYLSKLNSDNAAVSELSGKEQTAT